MKKLKRIAMKLLFEVKVQSQVGPKGKVIQSVWTRPRLWSPLTYVALIFLVVALFIMSIKDAGGWFSWKRVHSQA